MRQSQDNPERSPIAIGFEWSYRATGLGFELIVPTLAGVYGDQYFDTKPVLTMVGAVLGFTAMLTHMIQLAREQEKKATLSKTPDASREDGDAPSVSGEKEGESE